jgi:hypothetical protein
VTAAVFHGTDTDKDTGDSVTGKAGRTWATSPSADPIDTLDEGRSGTSAIPDQALVHIVTGVTVARVPGRTWTTGEATGNIEALDSRTDGTGESAGPALVHVCRTGRIVRDCEIPGPSLVTQTAEPDRPVAESGDIDTSSVATECGVRRGQAVVVPFGAVNAEKGGRTDAGVGAMCVTTRASIPTAGVRACELLALVYVRLTGRTRESGRTLAGKAIEQVGASAAIATGSPGLALV